MPSPLEIKQLAVEFLRNPKKSARAILGILRPSSIKRTVVARRKILLTAGLLFLATTLFFHKDSQLDASVERTQLLIHTDRFSFAPDSPVAFYAAGGRVHLHSFIQSVVIFDALSSKSVYQRAGLQVAITPGICQSYRGRGCDFAKVFTLSAGVLKPGLYKVEFGMGPGGKSELAWFMIHPAPEESNPESVALVFPSMTWQAYNKSGGANLYRPKRNPKYVSWRRPIVKNNSNRYSPKHLVVVPGLLEEASLIRLG